MPGDDVPAPPVVEVEHKVGECRERGVHLRLDHVAQPTDDLCRILVLGCERAQRVPQLAHRGGGADPLPHHVADDECDPPLGKEEGVVPVSADIDP